MRPPFGNQIFERAEELVDRRRLVIGLCAAVAVALIAAIPGVLSSAGSGRNVRTGEFAQVTPTTGVPFVIPVPGAPAAPAAPPTTSPALVLGSTFSRPTTTVPSKTPPKPAPKPAAAPPATQPAAPGPKPTTGTTAPFCHNSYDPACGPFRWDRAPDPNKPRTVTLSSASQNGAQVTIHAVVDDPDDAQAFKCPTTTYDFGDGAKVSNHCDPPPGTDACPTRYGPWSPPEPSDGGGQEDVAHTFPSTPGKMYTVTFTYDPGYEDACYNPYADGNSGSIQITVT